MNKILKHTLITGASLLILASAGAGASSLNAHASMAITYSYQYRMIKHAHGIPGTGMPHEGKVTVFGDNDTSGYVRGHRVVIGNDGTVLSISGRRPTRAMFNRLFRRPTRRYARRPVRRHAVKRNRSRKAIRKRKPRHRTAKRSKRKWIRYYCNPQSNPKPRKWIRYYFNY